MLILNRTRDALERQFPVPFIVWCTPRELIDLRRTAPDFFDHFTGIIRILGPAPPEAEARDVGEVEREVLRESAQVKSAAPRSMIRVYEQRLADPTLPAAQRVRALVGLAEVLAGLPGAEAVQQAERAVSLLQEALQGDATRDDPHTLRRIHHIWGDIEQARIRVPAAGQHYAEALRLSHKIIRDKGETPETLRDLSVSLDNVGDVERALGNPEAALAAFQQSLEIRERLLEQFGETPEVLADLAVSEYRIGVVKFDGDHAAAAQRHFTRARHLLQTIIQRGWGTADDHRTLAVVEQCLSKLAKSQRYYSGTKDGHTRWLVSPVDWGRPEGASTYQPEAEPSGEAAERRPGSRKPIQRGSPVANSPRTLPV